MTVANDPALYHSGYERNKNDAYFTEPWVTKALIKCFRDQNIPFSHVWEPACGRGDMVQVLKDEGCVVTYSDIDASLYDRDNIYPIQQDFLQRKIGSRFDAIITNPPYNLQDEFVHNALSYLYQGQTRLVAMLLRSEFKHAKKRSTLFEFSSFAFELVLTSRPRWDDWRSGEAMKSSPRHNFSWFVWDSMYAGTPHIYWGGKSN